MISLIAIVAFLCLYPFFDLLVQLPAPAAFGARTCYFQTRASALSNVLLLAISQGMTQVRAGWPLRLNLCHTLQLTRALRQSVDLAGQACSAFPCQTSAWNCSVASLCARESGWILTSAPLGLLLCRSKTTVTIRCEPWVRWSLQLS